MSRSSFSLTDLGRLTPAPGDFLKGFCTAQRPTSNSKEQSMTTITTPAAPTREQVTAALADLEISAELRAVMEGLSVRRFSTLGALEQSAARHRERQGEDDTSWFLEWYLVDEHSDANYLAELLDSELGSASAVNEHLWDLAQRRLSVLATEEIIRLGGTPD